MSQWLLVFSSLVPACGTVGPRCLILQAVDVDFCFEAILLLEELDEVPSPFQTAPQLVDGL